MAPEHKSYGCCTRPRNALGVHVVAARTFDIVERRREGRRSIVSRASSLRLSQIITIREAVGGGEERDTRESPSS